MVFVHENFDYLFGGTFSTLGPHRALIQGRKSTPVAQIFVRKTRPSQDLNRQPSDQEATSYFSTTEAPCNNKSYSPQAFHQMFHPTLPTNLPNHANEQETLVPISACVFRPEIVPKFYQAYLKIYSNLAFQSLNLEICQQLLTFLKICSRTLGVCLRDREIFELTAEYQEGCCSCGMCPCP